MGSIHEMLNKYSINTAVQYCTKLNETKQQFSQPLIFHQLKNPTYC